ncbi:MAG TPA: DNA-3-methyladenine glycosylase [Longimicrobiales bacterium]|nr:DNA-3-methyladenine glycosylase [Longimicrobiales bacterium]
MCAARANALPRDFYARDTETVARELLGKVLVSTIGRRRVAGRIVETEAYIGPHDPASHGAERVGRTKRNASMFGEPGIAYVYRIYGVHWCLNAVTHESDYPAAVLIRAIEPIAGLKTMIERRECARDRDVASGPGKLAQAFAIDADLDGHPLDSAPLWIEEGIRIPKRDVVAGPRIGITKAADWPLRFCVRGSSWLSRKLGTSSASQ